MTMYEPGDNVRAYETGFNAAHDVGGVAATIVRQMPDADDYEVVFSEEPPEGMSPIVTTDRLRLASEAVALHAAEATAQTAEAAVVPVEAEAIQAEAAATDAADDFAADEPIEEPKVERTKRSRQ